VMLRARGEPREYSITRKQLFICLTGVPNWA
jgi:hypothetical protein